MPCPRPLPDILNHRFLSCYLHFLMVYHHRSLKHLFLPYDLRSKSSTWIIAESYMNIHCVFLLHLNGNHQKAACFICPANTFPNGIALDKNMSYHIASNGII